MKKPRIFINMHYMALGGAERALLGLLNALDPERVDVDLFLNQHTGEFMPLIPAQVNLLPERRGYNAIERPMKTILKEGQFGVLYGRLKAKWQHNRYHRSLKEPYSSFDSSEFQYVVNCVEPFLDNLNDFGEYDLAISFLQPHNIVLNKVKAKKKIAWIHTDYSMVHVNVAIELPVWAGFDHIISISPDCTRSFLKKFPSLQDRIIEIENILSPSFVRQQAEQFDVSNEITTTNLEGGRTLKLLSIGRFCHQKNFENIPFITLNLMKLLSIGRFCNAKNYDNVPDISRRIVEAGYDDLHWYLIGFGGDEPLIRRKIEEAGMQDHVIILGKKENPYPYIKACDIYVQPSRYEGKSVTVREAQILCKPVVITNYPTASSQIKDVVDGIIVPMDNDGCAKGIVDFIKKKNLQNSIIDYLKTHDFGNESEIEKIYNLL